MGYRCEGQGFIVGVQIYPVLGLPSIFTELLQFILEPIEDIAWDSAVWTAVERGYEELNNIGLEEAMYSITLVFANLALSPIDNENLICCVKGWHHALNMCTRNNDHLALYMKPDHDRIRLALASKAERHWQVSQPLAGYFGSLLGVDHQAVNKFSEAIIHGGSAAALPLIYRRNPALWKAAHLTTRSVQSHEESVIEWLSKWQSNEMEETTWEDEFVSHPQFSQISLEDKTETGGGGNDKNMLWPAEGVRNRRRACEVEGKLSVGYIGDSGMASLLVC